MIGFSFLQRLSNSIILSTTIIIVFVIQYYASWLRMTTLEAKWMSKLWSPTENDDSVEIHFILLLLYFFYLAGGKIKQIQFCFTEKFPRTFLCHLNFQ